MGRLAYRILADEDHVFTRLRRHRSVQRKSARGPIRPWLAHVFLALLFAIQVATKSWGLVWFTGSLLVLTLSLPAIVGIFERRKVRRALRGKSESDLIATIELDQAGLRGRDAQAEVACGWPYFTKARSFEDGVLLYDAGQMMRWLPHAALVEGSSEQVEGLLSGNVADFAPMRRPKR